MTEPSANFDKTADEQAKVNIHKHKVVSLFSGCGGMDLGFMGGFKYLKRTYGVMPFEIVWANDISAAACKAYSHNLKHEIVCADIADIDIATIPKADVVIGGFPCQDFSISGKRQGLNSKRGQLYRFMVDVVEHCQPQVFIAENVKGLLSIDGVIEQITADFGKIGYEVQYRLLNASNYGVPQNRQRVLIVGTKPQADPFEYPDPEAAAKIVTAQQAIKDLEGVEWDGVNGHVWSKAKLTTGQGQKPIKADQPSTTIRAEHHGNIEYHYALDRRLSVREAARLQSFPDSFKLVSNSTESYRQIGNAVPPILAWQIANSVLDILQ